MAFHRRQCTYTADPHELQRSRQIPIRCHANWLGRILWAIRIRTAGVFVQAKSEDVAELPEKNETVCTQRLFCGLSATRNTCTTTHYKRYLSAYIPIFSLYIIHQLSKVVLVLLTWRFLMARSKKLRDTWSSILRLIIHSTSAFF